MDQKQDKNYNVKVLNKDELLTEEASPVLDFLQMLCEIGAHYPVRTDIHGLYQQKDGSYTVKVLKN
ncbi:hypothetical protein D5E71_25340, partial [Vibrio parahaemolyticus]